MNQTETNAFFTLLHNTEAIDGDANSLYLEAYDYVMDMVKDAIFEGDEVKNMYDLDNFINQVDSYAGDYEGEYGKGYQDAVDVLLDVVNQLTQDTEEV